MPNVELTIAHRQRVRQLRTVMVAEAWKLYGTPYIEIDCSHLVYRALNAARQQLGAAGGFSVHPAIYQSTATMESSGQWVKTEVPEPGDLVLWNGHVGIIIDPAAGKFIGAQTSTGVKDESYTTGYWATYPGKRFVRFYWF